MPKSLSQGESKITLTGEMEMSISGKTIQVDKSGVGHAWVRANDDNCPQNIQDEIASEIIDGGNESCNDYLASNGLHYRW